MLTLDKKICNADRQNVTVIGASDILFEYVLCLQPADPDLSECHA